MRYWHQWQFEIGLIGTIDSAESGTGMVAVLAALSSSI